MKENPAGRSRTIATWMCCLALAACGVTPSNNSDASSDGASRADTSAGSDVSTALDTNSIIDANAPDTTVVPDVVVMEVAAPDISQPEASRPDVAPPDVRVMDVLVPDVATVDVAMRDTSPADTAPPDVQPPADAGPPPSCSSTLAQRSVVTDLSDLMIASCSSFAGVSTSSVLCMRLAGAPDGTIRFAYADRGGMIRVLTIDATGQRVGRELTTMGTDVRAVHVYPDGDVAVLVLRGIVLAMVRFAPDGTVRFDQGLVGTNGMTTSGTRWAHTSMRAGAFTQAGANVAMYTTVAGNWGAQGIHQGDQLRMVNATGMIQSGGWDWGCSHSLDLRIAQSTGALAPVCLSDAYPVPGIILNNRTQLVAAPGWNQGGSIGSGWASRMIIPILGGVVPDGAGYFVSFASADGRPARDVALLRFEGTTAAPRRWITTGPAGALAYQVDLMRLGTGMLLYWEWVAGMETSANLQELDAMGAPVGMPVRMLSTDAANTLAFRGGEVPAISVPNGDAAFVGNRSGRTGPLRLVRVRACMR